MQTYDSIEVIVVDRFSVDATPDIARTYGASVITADIERAAARNRGALHANGDFLLFLDADMVLTPHVVEACVEEILRNRSIGGITIPERSVGTGYWSKVRAFERSFYVNTNVESARFFPAHLVRLVGGYDESVVFFEEFTLPYRIADCGYHFGRRVSDEILHIEEGFSLHSWLKKKFYYGMTSSGFFNRYGDSASRAVGIPFRLRIFLGSRRFYEGGDKAFSVLALKILEYLFTSAGRMVGPDEQAAGAAWTRDAPHLQ